MLIKLVIVNPVDCRTYSVNLFTYSFSHDTSYLPINNKLEPRSRVDRVKQCGFSMILPISRHMPCLPMLLKITCGMGWYFGLATSRIDPTKRRKDNVNEPPFTDPDV